jgi:hypothetical protein
MTDPITAGSILIQDGTHLPTALSLRNGSDSNGWSALNGARAAFEQDVHDAGWTFFFLAGEMHINVFGFDRANSLQTALRRLGARVKSHNCNGIEITQVTGKSFLKIPYISVSAHARHLQKGQVFSGQLSPHSI